MGSGVGFLGNKNHENFRAGDYTLEVLAYPSLTVIGHLHVRVVYQRLDLFLLQILLLLWPSTQGTGLKKSWAFG